MKENEGGSTSTVRNSAYPHQVSKSVVVLSNTIAIATLLLIVMGALVTNNEAGDSVPDWPLSFGQVVPVDQFSGLVVYEYSHRAIATLVGLLTVIFVFVVFLRDKRAWLRIAALVALAAVVIQGLLGGARVIYGQIVGPEVGWFAVAHSFLGQTVFCVMVTVAVMAGRGFAERSISASESSGMPPAFRVSPVSSLFVNISVVLIFIQVLIGAAYRHGVMVFLPHAIGAGLVAVFFGALMGMLAAAARVPGADVWLAGPARGGSWLLGIEIALGIVTYIRWREHVDNQISGDAFDVLLAAGHTVAGSLLLACSIMILIRFRRMIWSGRIRFSREATE